jgi:hypothetical protein
MPAHHLTTPPALTAPSPMLLPYITRELCFKALQTYRIQKKIITSLIENFQIRSFTVTGYPFS